MIVDSSQVSDIIESDGNHYVVLNVDPQKSIVHYSGACWTEHGEIVTPEMWDEYLRYQRLLLKNPLQISIGK